MLRVIRVLIGLLAAAFVPAIVARIGASIFWSQAAGIISGALLMFAALTPRRQRTTKTFLSFAAAMAIATFVSFVFQRAFFPWH